MCGIAGYFNKNKQDSYTKNKVSLMLDSIIHRGPDDFGIHLEDNFGSIGMRRLSIQDLSSNGHQPMFDESSLVCLVFNGEIYNANKKRDELLVAGFNFNSRSDTEVVLNLYLNFGDDFLDHLEGMFAIAIIDKREDRINPKLFMARDQVGIKPLYYSMNDEMFSFCSELTPFISAGIIKSNLNPNSLRQLLNFGSVKQPNTIFNGVNMLMPGHKLIYQNGNFECIKYWSLENKLNQFRSNLITSESPLIRVENSLRESVKNHLCGDVKIGTFLSGGIDSSLMAALLSIESPKTISTYSVGFNTNSDIKSELSKAKMTSKYLGTDHNEIIVNEKYVLDNIETFICSLDQPSVDGLNSFIISDYTAREVKVAISGTGGDELFAGYPWFRDMKEFKPDLISNSSNNFNKFYKYSFGGKLENLTRKKDFITYFSTLHHVFNLSETIKIMKPQVSNLNLNIYDDFIKSDVLKNEESILNRTSGLLLNTYLLNQLLRDIDACSMSKSLEVRVPFLSLDLIYNALSIDDLYKLTNKDNTAPPNSYRRNGEKSILFEISKKYLPPDFDMIPKNGFTLPFDDWLKGPLRNLVDESIEYLIINQSEFFDSTYLLSLKNDYFKNKVPWYKIWIFLILGRWLLNIDIITKKYISNEA